MIPLTFFNVHLISVLSSFFSHFSAWFIVWNWYFCSYMHTYVNCNCLSKIFLFVPDAYIWRSCAAFRQQLSTYSYLQTLPTHHFSECSIDLFVRHHHSTYSTFLGNWTRGAQLQQFGIIPHTTYLPVNNFQTSTINNHTSAIHSYPCPSSLRLQYTNNVITNNPSIFLYVNNETTQFIRIDRFIIRSAWVSHTIQN